MELEKEETKRVRIKRKEERKSLWRSKHTENMVHSMVVEMDNLALSDKDGDLDTMEYCVMEAETEVLEVAEDERVMEEEESQMVELAEQPVARDTSTLAAFDWPEQGPAKMAGVGEEIMSLSAYRLCVVQVNALKWCEDKA